MWVLQRKKIHENDDILEHFIELNDYQKQYDFGRSLTSSFSCPNVYVSRNHCFISFNEDSQPTIFDKGTLNGTFINGTRIAPETHIPLEIGDIIGLGVDSSLENLDGGYIYQVSYLDSTLNSTVKNEIRPGTKRQHSTDECSTSKIPKLSDDNSVVNLPIQEPVNNSEIVQEPDSDDIIFLGEDKLNYSTKEEEDIIVISDEEGEENFPNSQLFENKKEVDIDELINVCNINNDNYEEQDDDSVICEDDDDNFQRWVEVLSQEKSIKIKSEPQENYDFLLKSLNSDELDLDKIPIKPINGNNISFEREIEVDSPIVISSLHESLNDNKTENDLNKKTTEKIKLISPLPLPQKTKSKNSTKKIKKSTDEINKTSTKVHKNHNKKKKGVSLLKSPETINKEIQLEIRNQRKEKLKTIALNKQEVKKNNVHKIQSSEIKIKITKKSRGDILTEEFLSTPNTNDKSSIMVDNNETNSKKLKTINIEKINQTNSSPFENSALANKEKTNINSNQLKVPNLNSLPPIPKRIFSTNLNFVTGEKIISLQEGTNLNKNKTQKTKSVQFKEVIIKEYIIDDGCILTPTKNARYVEKKAPLIRKNQKDRNSKSISISSELIADIMGWRVSWLREAINNNIPPPVVDLKSLRKLLFKYSNFDEYKNIIVPLMYLEIWSSIHSDFINISLPTAYVILESTEINNTKLSQGKHLLNINCRMALSEKDKINSFYPKVGDLLILEIKQSNIEENSQSNKKSFTTVFGYVSQIKISNKYTSPDNNIFKNLIKDQNNSYDYDLRFQILTKYRNLNITIGNVMRLKVISQIRGHIKLMKALHYVDSSPLLKCIVTPTLKDFSLEQSKLKFYSQNEINEMQMKCVLNVTYNCLKSNRPLISLIQGPPGSGKTTMIVHMIMQFLHEQKRNPNYKIKILLCAPSNAAIDVITGRLLNINKKRQENDKFKIVRVGVHNSIHPNVQEISIKNLATATLNKNFLDSSEINLELRILEAKLHSLHLSNGNSQISNKGERDKLQTKINEYKNKIVQIDYEKKSRLGYNSSQHYEIQHEILQKADIVASTLSSCSTSLMENCFLYRKDNGSSFTCCIIDEATQSIEPETLIPLVFGIDKLILIGDQEQLPATVLSQYAKNFNFNQSLFTRLQELFSTEYTETPVMFLNNQYRMHPEILKFPNQFFYHNQLHTPQTIINYRDSFLHPYRIFDLDYIQKDNSDFSNPDEAKFVAELTYGLFEKAKSNNFKIGIITPYQKQKSTIIHSLNPSIKNYVWVNTIDSYQGQEKDIVIFSIGRSQGIGFLADHQRLNVALTRAKYSLIICGNFSSLKNHHLWKSLLEDSIGRNCYFSVRGHFDEDIIKKIIK